MAKGARITAKWAVGDLVQSKAGGPKMVVDSVSLPTSSGLEGIVSGLVDAGLAQEKAGASGIEYSCIWWVGHKRHRERFSEGGLTDWTESPSASKPA